MLTNVVRPLILSLTLACLASSSSSDRRNAPQTVPPSSDLTTHEWGTFTSIADRSGHAVAWLPLSGFSDLPDFVEHFKTAEFKTRLRGTVRMETPVLYFYSPRETTVSVKVNFSQGVITEWYPHATRIAPDPKIVLNDDALYYHQANGSISWDSVTVAPGLAENFPRSGEISHYYAARETDASPLLVRAPVGTEQEKFLFYRGVSTFSVPISAKVTADRRILVSNLGEEEIPAVILFERRGGRLGYRMGGAVQKDLLLDSPELNSNIASLNQDMEQTLLSQGLYPAEAHAMVETWSDSWFEEGSRIFYIVPRHFVDTIVPLAINPVPLQTVRAFVGRLELITPATERAVETALAHRDRDTIDKYGRFLEPILDQIKSEDPASAKRLDDDLRATDNVQPTPPPEK
ncbi:MAG TPA: hypothetical protein VIH89_06390 [Candidatus Sulfotelmatobacter sp.]